MGSGEHVHNIEDALTLAKEDGVIKRRRFLEGVVASVGIATVGCERQPAQPPAATPGGTPAPSSSPPQIAKVTAIREFPVTYGSSKGLFLTFEGLCAVVLPQQANDPVRIGLLAGHDHVATLKLHRDAVNANDSWKPSTSDDEYHLYALKGLQVNIKTQTAAVQYKFSTVADDCPDDDAAWANLGWALEVRGELQGKGALKREWWKDSKLVDAVFELDRGYIEGGFDGQEPIQVDSDVIKWKMPNGSMRVLKQIVRLRVNMNDVVLEARPLGSTAATTQTLTLNKQGLVYAGVKHFPLGPKRPRLKKDTPLDEVKAYYSLVEGFSGTELTPYAVEEGYDCPKQATPDCTCCPPGVYS